MPVCFLDSSALVKRYVRERGSEWLQQQTATNTQNTLYLARVTGIEVISAIARKASTGGISATDAALALADFRREFPTAYNIVETTPARVDEAMRLAEKHTLRAYDALQLAAALHVHTGLAHSGAVGVRLYSADADLNVAAKAEGLAVDDPNTHP